ncbi:MAG TPA: hypothetical protein PKK05_25145 [Leptospiraceae bacterium]|nr:hypothetical protein [Leptospiraceae bacterium]
MTEFEKMIRLLDENQIEYILIGGFAGAIHGSARLTSDIDIVYKRSKDNIQKLVNALKNHKPYLRGAPEGLPFVFDEKTLESGLNFTLTTDIGYIDLLAEVPGGNYDNILPDTIFVDVYNHKICCVNLERLIQLKRASGRPKDLEAISELEIINENNS